MHRADIHFHLVPGVDDGPTTVDESLELARLALREGTGTIVATPHVCDVEVDELADRVAELRRQLADAALPIEVICGGEVAADDVARLTHDELAVVAQGPERRRWVLLESVHHGDPDGFTRAADELRGRGFGVVVAHPERSAPLERGLGDAVAHEIAAGSWLQVNGESLVGRYGESARSAAVELLASELPVVVASDAHSETRPPCLAPAARAAREAGVAAARIRAAVDAGPWALLRQGVDVRTAAHASAPSRISAG